MWRTPTRRNSVRCLAGSREAIRAFAVDRGRDRTEAAAEVEADIGLGLLPPSERAGPTVGVKQQRKREHDQEEQARAAQEYSRRAIGVRMRHQATTAAISR